MIFLGDNGAIIVTTMFFIGRYDFAISDGLTQISIGASFSTSPDPCVLIEDDNEKHLPN